MGLYSIIRPTNIMLFENDHGSKTLAVLTLLILLSSMIMTITSIFQGLGHTYFPAVMVVIAFLLKYSLNLVLVPELGASGAAISSVSALSAILILFIIKLHRMMRMPLLPKRFYIMTILSVLMMMVVIKAFLLSTNFIYDAGYSERLMASFQALTAVLVGGLTYLILMVKTNLLTKSELYLLPFGSKLMVFLPKKKKKGRVDEEN